MAFGYCNNFNNKNVIKKKEKKESRTREFRAWTTVAVNVAYLYVRVAYSATKCSLSAVYFYRTKA